jgi:hypothetical protein
MYPASSPAPPSAAPTFAPQGVYVTDNDYLLVTSFASVAASLSIGGRMVDPRGRAVPFGDRHVANTDRTAATSIVRLGEGWLQQVSVGIASGTPIYGQAYVRIDVARGDGNARTVLGTLVAGFVTSTVRLGWPGSLMHGPLERPGIVRSITGSDPAAGAEISETVPTGARWRLLAIRFVLVTDATVANRNPALLFDDGTNEYFAARGADNQTASLTVTYTGGQGLNREASVSSRAVIALPAGVVLLAGHRIRTSTAGIVAGDNYGAPQYLVEESLEGA